MKTFEIRNIQRGSFKDVCNGIENLVKLVHQNPEIRRWLEYTYEKKESSFIEYQHKESITERVLFRDRRHPLDSIILNNYKQKTGNETGIVNIEYGPSSDEYTRSHHALAIAVADTIYFRNGAYRPETEEGRKLLAHELTHVAQYREKEDYRNISKAEKEYEAESFEKIEEFLKDKKITKKIGAKEYTLKESEWKLIERKAIEKLEYKIEEWKFSQNTEKYLEILIKYKEWIENRK